MDHEMTPDHGPDGPADDHELEIDDDALEMAAGGIKELPTGPSGPSVNSTIYFQTTITHTNY